MLTVVTGCMFSGKTETLQRFMYDRVNRYNKGVLFTADSRHNGKVVSHSGIVLDNDFIDVIYIDPKNINTEQLILHSAQYRVIGFDEINFFDHEILIGYVKSMINHKDICMVGLNTDYKEEPFYSTMHMLGRADVIIHKTAYCDDCHAKATLTIAKKKMTNRIVEGGSELYVPKCRKCKLESVKSN